MLTIMCPTQGPDGWPLEVLELLPRHSPEFLNPLIIRQIEQRRPEWSMITNKAEALSTKALTKHSVLLAIASVECICA